jgi:pimeloyl-ACP methyl ester carboxylesterase
MQQGQKTKQSGKFQYLDEGEGTPIIVLHGLMGGLSNFSAVTTHFSKLDYRVIIPVLPLYDLP